MLERNTVVISEEKSAEFSKMAKKVAKNKDFWKKNEEYLHTHKVDLAQLEALYKK